jgi:hypothetical protein
MSEINPGAVDQGAFRGIRFGFAVPRVTGNIAQTGSLTLFTVAGGRVVLNGIIGQVTTIIQAQANAAKLLHTPTVGTLLDLCATLDINAKEVGALFGITGTFATAMVGANAGACVLPTNPIVLPVGNLRMNCAASSTGQVQWTCWYLPLDEGASLVAA